MFVKPILQMEFFLGDMFYVPPLFLLRVVATATFQQTIPHHEAKVTHKIKVVNAFIFLAT